MKFLGVLEWDFQRFTGVSIVSIVSTDFRGASMRFRAFHSWKFQGVSRLFKVFWGLQGDIRRVSEGFMRL